MVKLIVDLWRDVQDTGAIVIKYLWHIFLYVLYIAILIYVFSLLETRLEFIVVSSCGLIYTVIAAYGIETRNAAIGDLQMTMIAIGKMRLLLNDTTKEEQEYGTEMLTKLMRARANWILVDITYFWIVEIICLYQLFKHLGSTYVDFITRYIPPNVKPYF